MGDCQLSVVPRLHLEYSHYLRMETISVLLPTNDAGSARQKLPRLRRMRDFDFPILQDLETAANPDFIDDIVRELTEGE